MTIGKLFVNKKDLNKLNIFTISYILLIILFGKSLKYLQIPLYLFSIVIGLRSIKYSLVIIIISYTNIFSLCSASNIDWAFYDLGLLVAIFSFIRYMITKNKSKNKESNRLFLFVLSILFLMSFSIIIANIRYNQPIIRGILSFRSYLVLLFIIPLRNYFKQKNNVFIILEHLNFILTIVSVILLIQYTFLNNINFIPIRIAGRNGVGRILIHEVSPLICLVFGYCLLSYKLTLKKFISIIMYIIDIFIISKTRIYMLCLIIIFFLVGIVLNRRLKVKLKVAILFLFISISIILLFTPIVNIMIQNIFSDVLIEGDNYIRLKAQHFYLDQIRDEMFILGGGITNEKFENSPINQGSIYNYYLADIGIYGFYFEFGIMGIVSLVLLIIYSIFNIKKQNNRYIKNLGIVFLTIIIFTMFTVCPFSYPLIPILSIVLSVINLQNMEVI